MNPTITSRYQPVTLAEFKVYLDNALMTEVVKLQAANGGLLQLTSFIPRAAR